MNKLMNCIEKVVRNVSDFYVIEYNAEYVTITLKVINDGEIRRDIADKINNLPEYQGKLSLDAEVDDKHNEIVLWPATMYLDELDDDKYYITN